MSSQIKEKVLKIIQGKESDLADLIQSLVKHQSVTGEEGECQRFVAEKMKDIGLKTDVWEPDMEQLRKHKAYVPVETMGYTKGYENRPNVVGTLKGSGRQQGKSIILNGHVDVVPIGNKDEWTHDPWGGEFVDGKIYGRGSCDMKAGLGALIAAVEAIASLDVKLKGDVIIESVVDEEAGGNGTLGCVLKGYKADAAIFAEPSGLSILCPGSRGAQFFRVTVPGKSIGIEYMYYAVNAIEKAIKIYEAVSDFSLMRQTEAKHPLWDLYPPDVPKVPTAICKISGGEWPSSTPTKVTLEGSLECLPKEDINEIKRRFKNYIMKVAQLDPWLSKNKPVVEWFGLWMEPSEIKPDHPIVKQVVNETKVVTGAEPLVVGGGGSDQRLLTIYGDTPSILFGPGGEESHGVDENIELKEVLNYTKIVALTILDWCGKSQ
nr:ArgE/DapE family deacylase [Candidatus Njordarchaeum guaymaensis]